jgi:hypothetical protein
MADAMRMEIIEAIDDLAEKFERRVFREATASDKVVEKLPMGGELDEDVEMPRALADIDKAKQAWVVDKSHQRNFSLDSVLEIGFRVKL